MMWTVIFVVALAVGQVPARPEEAQYEKADFVENVRGVSSDSRILSGWEAYPGQLPYHVSLRMVDPNGAGFACGASLIARNWVISAAHCTANRAYIVIRAGVVHVATPEFTTETTEWFNHPTFVDQMAHVVQPNDIALLKLNEDVPYTRLTQPIRVQPRVDAFRNYNNLRLVASGHGRTWTNGAAAQVLNWVYLRGVTNFFCSRTFGEGLINNNAICAQYYNVTSQSTCQGDSGGPLVHVDADGVPTLVGIASFVAGGHHGCHSGLPAGFIRPGPFHNWFTQVTGLDFDNLVEEDDETETPTEPTTTTTTTTTTQAPTTTTTTQAPTTTTTQAPTTTPAPEEEEESESESSEEDEEDPELKDLLKRLEVMVKVKVRMSKLGKKIEHGINHNKTVEHRR
ncbi:hypothetical protein ABMA27_008714 [Loxostege sticticalis]|uniref:Peptidase S1 domain-containing protein n=1 Tax=Loxostege sticticalis TaxID=481309 RepID=A0ABR3HCC4_LOXSC